MIALLLQDYHVINMLMFCWTLLNAAELIIIGQKNTMLLLVSFFLVYIWKLTVRYEQLPYAQFIGIHLVTLL